MQLIANGSQQFLGTDLGIQHHRDIGVARQLIQQAARNRGFAGAYFTGQQHKTAVCLKSVQQMRQRFPVPFTHVEKTGIGRDGKGGLFESEIVVVHESDQSVIRAPVTRLPVE